MTDIQTFEFQPEHDGSLPLETAVFQALGAASVCWDPMDGTGVFQSEQAKSIGDALVAYVRDHAHSWTEYPLLGLATTAELLDELKARVESNARERGEIGHGRTVDDLRRSMSDAELGYRTVDS